MRTRGLWVVALGLIAGCIPEARLQPLPEARPLAGDTSAAVAEAHGVRLVADGAAWDGYPKNLERRLTPVEVRLENHSGRALSIRYELFVEDGGSVAGFLFFQGVAEREKQVTLQAQLVDASTGEQFGRLSIPFQVARR